VLFGLACLALFFPSRALVSPAYLGLGLFLLYLGWSMMQIPYLAWSGRFPPIIMAAPAWRPISRWPVPSLC
jgi:Na+/melibiose symporter-like transporter